MLNTEVTQKQYQAVMGANPSKFKGENNPVECVSWYDAIYFCNKLSDMLGYTPVYAVDGETDVSRWGYRAHKGNLILGRITQNPSANGFRLPTIAEWQYSAKGGENYTYAGSNNLDEVGWYSRNSGSKTHPVAQKKANGYGLYDMSGNVWEWVWDSDSSNGRYSCGGSWGYNARHCKVDNRYGYYADNSNGDLGFRFVRNVER